MMNVCFYCEHVKLIFSFYWFNFFQPVIGLRWVIELILNLVRMGEASEMAKPSKQMGIGEVNMPPKWFVPLFSTQVLKQSLSLSPPPKFFFSVTRISRHFH